MDSIDVFKEHIVFNHYNPLAFVIQQESIRFEQFKTIAVYRENNYLGTYRIVWKRPFTVRKLSEIVSLLFFGCRREDGIKELKKISIKGRISDNSKMAILCLEKVGYDKKYEIKKSQVRVRSYA